MQHSPPLPLIIAGASYRFLQRLDASSYSLDVFGKCTDRNLCHIRLHSTRCLVDKAIDEDPYIKQTMLTVYIKVSLTHSGPPHIFNPFRPL